ncbi:hypothetical protein C2845_PM09G03740 [Panicum miliaceum]|uniref:Uncharacterized protein n=1 Tax=Panicum miliaceum TaxID=4540 RepID=A0A3L6S090_PANMI|nr:hypothetical protein C2845_PM09G03740 [Panicum miliaceum]
MIQSGLGREPATGEVSVDPIWYAAIHGDRREAGAKFKCPPCCEQLCNLLGHTPRDRGQLVSAGLERTEPIATDDTPKSPHDMSVEPIEPTSAGQTSKRPFKEHSVCSPRKKSSQTPSIDDCVQDLDDIVRDNRERKTQRIADDEEIARVNRILKEDGYREREEFFVKALNVCRDRLQRRAFLDMESKEGRWNYVNFTWDYMTLKAK